MAQQRAIRKNSTDAGRGKSRTLQPPKSTASLQNGQLLHLQQTFGNEMVGRLIHAKSQAGVTIRRQANDQRPEGERSIASTLCASKGLERRLIVDDEAVELAPGQMRKSEFLAQLRNEVCRAADEAMATSGQSTEGCPYLESWFEFYSAKDSEHTERALHKFAPETADATSAMGYIPLVSARVRRSVERWARSGEITGAPEELIAAGPGGGVTAALSGLASGIGAAVTSVAEGIGEGIAAVGRLLFKGRTGRQTDSEDPRTMQMELGAARPLDASVKARMESAFGTTFSHVRVHAGAGGREASDQLNARAFTVGHHIVFGTGEYQPGTLAGDALIAHELAHVMQQGNGSSSAGSILGAGAESGALEEEADISAASAVASAWGGKKGSLAGIGRNVQPRRHSGMRLQRCAAASTQRRQAQPANCPSMAPDEWRRGVREARESSGTAQRDAMVRLVRQALCPSNIEVAVAGEGSRDQVDPGDYQPAPIVNFDINLNRKQSWPSRPGAPTRSLANNYGYFFTRGSTVYAVIGPQALDPATPAYTRRAAEHELFHTEQHAQSTEGNAENELEAWTHDFVNYFHQLGRKTPQGIYLGATWTALLNYYQRASEEARQNAITQLVNYYNNPPGTGADQENVREMFRLWLGRRDPSNLLIQHLNDRLQLGAPQR